MREHSVAEQSIVSSAASFLLLFERPFRVGMVLDVGGQRGMVTAIGLRASRAPFVGRHRDLIPNSSLSRLTSPTGPTPSQGRFASSRGGRLRFHTPAGDPTASATCDEQGVVEKDPRPRCCS